MINCKPNERPLQLICPQKFCFFWREAGDIFAVGLYESIDDALQKAKPTLETGCGCSFGVCVRSEKEKGERDWYEPCEPELREMGLPWFYFCDPNKLNKKYFKEYKKYFKDFRFLVIHMQLCD